MSKHVSRRRSSVSQIKKDAARKILLETATQEAGDRDGAIKLVAQKISKARMSLKTTGEGLESAALEPTVRAYLIAEHAMEKEKEAEKRKLTRKPSGLGGLFGSSEPVKSTSPSNSSVLTAKAATPPTPPTAPTASTPSTPPTLPAPKSEGSEDQRKGSGGSTLPLMDLMPVEGVAPQSSSWEERHRRKSAHLKQLAEISTEYRDIKYGRLTYRLRPGCNVYAVVTQKLEEEGELEERLVVQNMEKIQAVLHKDAQRSDRNAGFCTGAIKTSILSPTKVKDSKESGERRLSKTGGNLTPHLSPGARRKSTSIRKHSGPRELVVKVKTDKYKLVPGMDVLVWFSQQLSDEGRIEELNSTLASVKRQLEKNAQNRPTWQQDIITQLNGALGR